ncbi:geranylgeranyl diphosphate synthase 1, isoform CRA_a [Blyttiomyces helicus]|uniref:Geranylgeranyl diphosphate synthase 1, isoform CRA_a n=1 Tax=Blyttiomyces helicus TaxID=388810 RepID=A0A4P9W0Q0_9FUNG|nr:geranylgeranyl diphosphate synthase 1, isoform CRA_a [Blyttiomyces helicus]|eukprot:RKO85719.1 geranylgeranyl diphosphate synthase 1, isoform CRA_a [Blyttiomyces helicus]
MAELSEKQKSNEKILLEPYQYLRDHPGKEIRTRLVAAFGLWMSVPQDALDTIREVVEMLHTASLLIDDVEDDSDLRRGVPVAHKIYGIPLTINCANYVYFLALQKVMTLESPTAIAVFTEELLQLHRGQGMDIHWRDSVTCPEEEDYLEMVRNKTGGLLRLAVKLMQICSGSTTDYCPVVDLLGLHFQIRDDYINLQSRKYMDNKGFAEDLTEGKFSFPIIHCIKTGTASRQMLSDLHHLAHCRRHPRARPLGGRDRID